MCAFCDGIVYFIRMKGVAMSIDLKVQEELQTEVNSPLKEPESNKGSTRRRHHIGQMMVWNIGRYLLDTEAVYYAKLVR